MKSYLQALSNHIFSPLQLFLVLSISTILTVSGAFGTYVRMNLLERGVYWGAVVVLALVTVFALKIPVDRKFAGSKEWQRTALLSVIFTVVYTPMLWWFANTFAAEKRDYITPFWTQIFIVFGLSMAVAQLKFLLQAEKTRARARIFERFIDPEATEIHRITVRDHYVDVFTNRGKETLLMRFSDALAELDGIIGEKVHRSHWVAREAVDRMDREKGRNFVVLKDGSRVPVSRANREIVESWLT